MLRYVLCLAGMIGLAAPAMAERLSLDEISAYLDRLQTVRGEFTQVNEDNTISTGRIFIKRPGRVRFEYDPPERTLVIANGTQVGIVDGKSNTNPEIYPLRRTPLKIILARDIDLTRERMVTGHSSDGATTTVRAQDPENPEYGAIEMVFTRDPVELRQWIIDDGNGSRTTVVLGDVETGMELANNRFEIPGQNRESNR